MKNNIHYEEKNVSEINNEKLQNFLKKLEKGNDNILFSAYDKYSEKAFKRTHFGLSTILIFAFDLMKKEDKNNNIDFLQIPFSNFYDYVENAKNILTEMKYINGDRTVPNEFGIKVYENPKNYSVVDLNDLLPITDEQLKIYYITEGIHINNNCFIKIKTANNKIHIKLSPREKEAFYGTEAKKALGLIKKQYTKTLNNN